MTIPGIILAAGGSRRLGRPKQLVEVAEETLLQRTMRVVREAGADPCCVVLGAKSDEILKRLDPRDYSMVFNENWGRGIAFSIQAGLDWLTGRVPDASGILLSVCDQPRLSVAHVRTLLEKFEEAGCEQIVTSTYEGVRGVPAVFSSAQIAELWALEGDEGARGLLQRTDRSVIEVPFEDGAIDIDTPADLAALFRSATGY